MPIWLEFDVLFLCNGIDDLVHLNGQVCNVLCMIFSGNGMFPATM